VDRPNTRSKHPPKTNDRLRIDALVPFDTTHNPPRASSFSYWYGKSMGVCCSRLNRTFLYSDAIYESASSACFVCLDWAEWKKRLGDNPITPLQSNSSFIVSQVYYPNQKWSFGCVHDSCFGSLVMKIGLPHPVSIHRLLVIQYC
jgi:hypothetical protein